MVWLKDDRVEWEEERRRTLRKEGVDIYVKRGMNKGA